MKILEVEIANFLAIQQARVALNGRGLVLIQGKNEDEPSATSNGAGKSSIPDALMWCLFGETARGVGADQVVNEKAKKDCYVSVTLQDGDSVYQVVRFRKHKVEKNALRLRVWNPADTFPMGASTSLEKGTERETQEQIDAILGCSREVFCAAVYAGQEAMPDLPRATDKQLKILIEEAAGVERLQRADEIARQKRTTAEVAVVTLRNHIQLQQSSMDALVTRKAEAEKLVADYEADRPKVAKDHTESAQVYATQVRELAAKVAGAGEPALIARRDEIGTALAEHSKLLAKRDELQRARDAAERATLQTAHQYDNARGKVAEIQKHIADAPSNVGKPCRTCSKPHTQDDLNVVLANLTAQLKEAAVHAASLKPAHEQAAKAEIEAQTALTAFVVPDVSALAAEQRQINEKLLEIQKWRGEAKIAKSQYDSMMQVAKNVMTDPNPFASALTEIQGQIRELQQKIDNDKARLAAAERDFAIAEAVVKVFGPAGVRAHILDTVTPFLNERTSEYLSALSDGNLTAVWSTLATTAKGELREKFNIEVENATGAKSFAGISGGEKRKVRLATMLALQDLVASRATKPIDLWIGDEVDDALDPAGLERLMGVLEKKARERGTVLVISHNELSDWADNVATVTKRGGYSHIEGAIAV